MKLKPQGTQVLMIDTSENIIDAAAFTKLAKGFAGQHQLTMPVLMDINGKASTAYKVNAIPTNVIIDSKGVVRYWGEGYDPDAEWKVLRQLGVR